MNYKDRLIPELKALQDKREALVNIPEKIRILEMRYGALRAAQTDAQPVSGSSISCRENDLLCNIAERDALKMDLEATQREVDLMEGALHKLSEVEQRVIDYAYINRRKGYIEQLSEELGYERAQIYNIRKNAMTKLARKLYGQVKL